MILKDYLKTAFAVATLAGTTSAIHLEIGDKRKLPFLRMLTRTPANAIIQQNPSKMPLQLQHSIPCPTTHPTKPIKRLAIWNQHGGKAVRYSTS